MYFLDFLQKIVVLKRVDFVHCSMSHLLLNLWTYWACIKNGKYYEHLSPYIDWNLFYVQRRWPGYYLPFEIVYEKIKKQDELFCGGYFIPGNERQYGYFLQSLNY